MRINVTYAHFKTPLFMEGLTIGDKLGNNKQKPVEMIYDFDLKVLLVKTKWLPEKENKKGIVPVTDISSMVSPEFDFLWDEKTGKGDTGEPVHFKDSGLGVAGHALPAGTGGGGGHGSTLVFDHPIIKIEHSITAQVDEPTKPKQGRKTNQ